MKNWRMSSERRSWEKSEAEGEQNVPKPRRNIINAIFSFGKHT